MKFDTPAGPNPIDRLAVIGRPTDRIDGPLKTSGTATYAYEHHHVAPDQAYGVIVGSAIAKGRIAALHLDEARACPGVLAIVTHENAGPLGKGAFYVGRPLAGPEIQHYHQAIALVVAETFEQAREAAALVRADYEEANGSFELADALGDAVTPGTKPDVTVGDFAAAFAAAPVTLDERYTTPDQSHAMMEPHATVAVWDGDRLTIWAAVQIVAWSRRDLANILDMPEEKIRIVASFIGGGFGGKGTVSADAVLASLGARVAGRAVKVAQARPLMFNNTTHRAATIQRIRLGAERDGTLTAIAHESWSGNLPDGMTETAAEQTRLLYAGAHRLVTHRRAVLDLPEASALRAPGEAPGMMALEVAMDEMAEKLGIDPVEFRIINDTQVDPEKPERTFSKRALVECLRTGADRFGWSARSTVPGALREGRWLIGTGMAAAIRGAPLGTSAARVRLEADGRVVVETDMTDIGTGTYTIIGQTAAEMMGVPLSQVTVRLGDSDFPVSVGSGGQWGANCSTAGVYAACVKLREAVAQRLGFNATDAVFDDGQVSAGNRRVPLADAAAAGALTGEDEIEFADLAERYAQQTFGAHFCEVAVDTFTGEIRIRRMLAVCAAGRILNPKAARSQIIGGMTMGAGAALTEELVVDRTRGFFVNHDLASYEVPVHADIPHQEVIFLDETDPVASPMKAKGVGELGISGVAAAVANAVHNATGVRVRDYPVTLDKLLDRLPATG
ncbi:aldehyde oxidoreductase molybdenum-binding subunit PaoC [Sphingomonas solaris]|uniref:Xanthine dehydrogenase family protein molybdopterin-binding subunit n=1 Tax=Alterirhizorhabdus solaris TaxID=2529389 RepID=A0A558QU67_9SPHN|nr:aldehyde oxidoreductase molybdenum-binding subunit PaoC [Sphingomonas solaris]TVV70701.1 xanthine dehydrogenase family protein molybdopterin-binding subunit [Sphingomonas solaris]